MKKKPLSEYSLEELHQQRKDLKSSMIRLRNGWILIFFILILFSKGNLLPTFIPLGMATLMPTYASMNRIDIEVKKRQENQL